VRPGVLEENVGRLLRRSYVPALPTPEFRDRLEGLVLAEVRRSVRQRRGAPARPVLAGRGWPLVAAAAAALLLLLAGWQVLGGAPQPTRARLLARGEAALGLADGSWRAADGAERVHGVHVALLPLQVVTPAGVGLDLLVEQGRVRLEERSELHLARSGDAPTATLVTGAAAFHHAGGRLVLVPGPATPLVAPAPIPASLAQEPAPAGREPRPLEPAAPAGGAAAARLLGGRVSADGLPVPAFSVALLAERRSHETRPPRVREFESADGFFEWPDPPRGKQRVFVHAPGFALCALGEHDLSAAPPELSAELVAGVSVRGSVLDADGNPVPGALVIAEDEAPTDGLLFLHSEHSYWLPVRAETGADGRFTLEHVTPGQRSLRIEAEGFATAWVDGVSTGEGAREELVVRLGRGGAIEGRVERDDGGPWAEAEVVAVAMDQHERTRQSVALARTDGEGRFRFEHLPPIPMLVVLLRSELQPDVRPVQVETGRSATCDFPAPREGTRVRGQLRAADGTPAALRNLGLFELETASWNQDWVASTTDLDGNYVFEGVLPGRYALYLVDQLGRGLRCLDELSVAAGAGEVEHDLVLSSGLLEVRARAAADGEPVAQAALMVMRHEEDGHETFGGYEMLVDGRAQVGDLRPGRYSVQVYPTVPGIGLATSEVVEVRAGEATPLELLLEPGGAVQVVVRTPDGRPLEGAAVVFRDARGREHQLTRVPTTDARGRYAAFGFLPGRYRVLVALDGFERAAVPFDFQLGHEPEIPVVLSPLAPR